MHMWSPLVSSFLTCNYEPRREIQKSQPRESLNRQQRGVPSRASPPTCCAAFFPVSQISPQNCEASELSLSLSRTHYLLAELSHPHSRSHWPGARSWALAAACRGRGSRATPPAAPVLAWQDLDGLEDRAPRCCCSSALSSAPSCCSCRRLAGERIRRGFPSRRRRRHRGAPAGAALSRSRPR